MFNVYACASIYVSLHELSLHIQTDKHSALSPTPNHCHDATFGETENTPRADH